MMRRIEYFETPDGSRLRLGYWKRLIQRDLSKPTMLILQGRASFLEKFEKIIEGFCQRGYDVWSFDWRGQGLSSRQLKNPRKGHIDSYETYLKDLDLILKHKILPDCQGPLIVLAQSMGSHLALRYMIDYASCFDLAILTAPMLELNTGGYSKAVAQLLSKACVKVGLGSMFVMGHGAYDPLKEPFEGNMLTHDRESFLYHRSLQKLNPLLTIGGVTYGWVHATFESINKLNYPENLKKIKIPVLVIAAGQEFVVNNQRLEQIVSWMPRATLKVYATARHQILSECPGVITQFWHDSESFIAVNLSTGGYQPSTASLGGSLPLSSCLPSELNDPLAFDCKERTRAPS